MLHIKIWMMFIVMMVYAQSAHALSCAVPTVNKQVLESYAVIFEGRVIARKDSAMFGLKHSHSKPTRYTFKVTKHWRGEMAQAETIDVVAPPRWAGQVAYKKDKTYVVFANYPKNKKGEPEKQEFYAANPGWCGLDMNGIDANRGILEKYFGQK